MIERIYTGIWHLKWNEGNGTAKTGVLELTPLVLSLNMDTKEAIKINIVSLCLRSQKNNNSANGREVSRKRLVVGFTEFAMMCEDDGLET